MTAELKIKVSSKGQIVIPAEVRRHFKVFKGGILIAEFKDGKLIITSEEQAFKQRKKNFLEFAEKISSALDEPVADAMKGQRR